MKPLFPLMLLGRLKIGRRSDDTVHHASSGTRLVRCSSGAGLARFAQSPGTTTSEFAPEFDIRFHGTHQPEKFGLGVVAPPAAASVEFEQIVATTFGHGQPLTGYFIAVPPGKFV